MGSGRIWCAVSALDVFAAALSGGGGWPTVLRPASVAQHLDAAGSASEIDPASDVDPSSEADPASDSGAGPGPGTAPRPGTAPPPAPAPGERLCAHAMGLADAAPVRAVHWFLGPRGTLIAESAWGSGVCVVLVGWAPYEDEGAPEDEGARRVGGPAAGRAAIRRAPLPGALLLGVFDTADAARRLAELLPESAHGEAAVVGRWALPDACPPMSVRSVVHPEPGVLRRELVTQLSEAFVRVQEGVQARTQDPTR